MNILVVGSGGREHAIIQKLSQSPRVKKLYCAPGNGGIVGFAQCIDCSALDTQGIIAAAKKYSVDIVFVAPDDPLGRGMVDELEAAGIKTFGPRKNAAMLESSKAFAKEFMKRNSIPTAGYEVFDNAKSALSYIKSQKKYPTVIKADGLSVGKGVIIAQDYAEAEAAIKSIMEEKIFGDSGSRVVIEEFLTGPEISVLAFTDGKTLLPMVSAQDHKRAYDDDKGANTGGMGAFSPSAHYTDDVAEYCEKYIMRPTIAAMAKEGAPFKGVLYFGLMLTPDGLKVIEYNARFGDPETQVVLPRLKTDLLDIMEAIIDERLSDIKLEWDERAAVCVVAASDGYPAKYKTGFEIKGTHSTIEPDVDVYHAGTKILDGKLVTSGGRVLGVTALGENVNKAAEKVYSVIDKISFEGMRYRHDIGKGL